MNHSLEGSCQCGEVHYQIKGEPLVLYRCHCTECQKQSGSGFGMSMWIRNDDFEILKGSLKHFQRDCRQRRKDGVFLLQHLWGQNLSQDIE